MLELTKEGIVMLNYFKKAEVINKAEKMNEIYARLKEYTHYDELREDRKEQLRNIVRKYGYLNYPHLKVLEELSAAETLCALEIKWEDNGERPKFYPLQLLPTPYVMIC